MRLLLTIFIFCSAFIAFKPIDEGLSLIGKPTKVNAFAAVQTAGTAGSGTSVSVTVTSTTINNLVIVGVRLSTSFTVTSITDNQSNTYVLSSAVDQGTDRLYRAYGCQVTGGVTSVTANLSGSTGASILANEYSGFTGGGSVTNANVYDVGSTGNGNGTSLATGTFTPSAAGQLCVAVMYNSLGGFAAGAGYTLYGTVSGRLRTQYDLSGTTSETAPATSSSGDWTEIADSYKVPAAAAATPVLGAVGNMALNKIKTNIKQNGTK